MQIYINNRLAALKQGTSVEYVSENRLFSGSDGYTLTITFPLRDCPQNIAIFGHINRSDVTAGKVIFDCEIRDKSFYKFGCITVTEINEAEVKTQFLDGRSEQNFDDTLDKIYINELDLGSPSVTSASSVTPSAAWQANQNAVALPWVNDASGNIQNCAIRSGSSFAWHSDTSGLSWQPYLLYITKKICEQIGYDYDFSLWESQDEYKYLLICNCLPYAWYSPGYAAALPQWTVEEYFSKLELFLGCEFNFDHRAKSVSFAFTKDIVNAKPKVRLNTVVEEHSTEVKIGDNQCEYSEAINLGYKECDHAMWKYYSCDWFIRPRIERASRYETLSSLLAATSGYASWDARGGRGSIVNNVFYAADVDAYFILRTVSRVQNGYMSDGKTKKWIYKCKLTPINLLGPRIVDDSEDAKLNEIEFVPACINYTDDTYGDCLFLSFGSYDDGGTATSVRSQYEVWSDAWYEERNSRFTQTQPAQSLEAGASTKKSEYYDRIYIAWWDGVLTGQTTPPHPHVQNIAIADNFGSYRSLNFSLRLNDRNIGRFNIAPSIEPSMKTTFKFIADSIPDPRSLFIIRGKRYVCEKLTATFTESGMSQLIKGVFFPVKEGEG